MRNLISQAVATPQVARAPQSARSAPTADYGVLKALEKELKNQLEDVQDRRNDLARETEQSTGPTQAGVQARVAVLDQRLSSIEGDLTDVGRQLAAAAPASIAAPPARIIRQGYGED